MTILSEFHSLGTSNVVFTLTISNELQQLLTDDFNFEMCLRLFSLTEQLKIRSKRYGKIKELLNRLFTRCILNLCMGKSDLFSEVRFTYNKFGKPFIDCDGGKMKFQYNASTSNDVLSIVVQFDSITPIGIDLSHSQQKLGVSTCVEDFKQIFGPDEYEFLSEIENENDRYLLFNQFWTLKEAFTKLLGCGLNVELSNFQFKLSKDLLTSESSYISAASRAHDTYLRGVVVAWNSNILVDPSKLYNTGFPFIVDLENNFYCLSGRLSSIVISVISQVSIEKDIKVQEFNMRKVLQEYLNSL